MQVHKRHSKHMAWAGDLLRHETKTGLWPPSAIKVKSGPDGQAGPAASNGTTQAMNPASSLQAQCLINGVQLSGNVAALHAECAA